MKGDYSCFRLYDDAQISRYKLPKKLMLSKNLQKNIWWGKDLEGRYRDDHEIGFYRFSFRKRSITKKCSRLFEISCGKISLLWIGIVPAAKVMGEVPVIMKQLDTNLKYGRLERRICGIPLCWRRDAPEVSWKNHHTFVWESDLSHFIQPLIDLLEYHELNGVQK